MERYSSILTAKPSSEATPALGHNDRAGSRGLTLTLLVLAAGILPVLTATGRSEEVPKEVKARAWDTTLPPREWAQAAASNELLTLRYSGSYLRYRMHVKDAKGDRVRIVMETRDGSVARLILRDGKRLDAAEDQAERERLQAMLASPQDFARHIRNQESGKKYAEQIIRLIPDAMIYTYTPGQPQTASSSSSHQVVLDYQPARDFRPPTTASQVLSGVRGRIWIDAASRNIVRMEGVIFQSENFGWGVLAHVNPGGKLLLIQAKVGPGRWIFTHFSDQIAMRVGLIKSVTVDDTTEAFDFEPIAAMSYQDAIRSLLSLPLPAPTVP